jgi:hypothetical protein
MCSRGSWPPRSGLPSQQNVCAFASAFAVRICFHVCENGLVLRAVERRVNVEVEMGRVWWLRGSGVAACVSIVRKCWVASKCVRGTEAAVRQYR